jgi:hypothetical protein
MPLAILPAFMGLGYLSFRIKPTRTKKKVKARGRQMMLMSLLLVLMAGISMYANNTKQSMGELFSRRIFLKYMTGSMSVM